MDTPLPTRLQIAGEAEFEAFCSIPRFEILAALTGLETASATEIAFATNRPADTLYRHLSILVESGLVVEVDTRRVGRQSETRYRLGAVEPTADLDLRDPDAHPRALRVAKLLHRRAEKHLEASMKAGLATTKDGERTVSVQSQSAWFTEEDLAAFQQRLDELGDFLRERQVRRGGSQYCFTMTFSPMHRERGFDARGAHRHEAMVEAVEADGADETGGGSNASE